MRVRIICRTMKFSIATLCSVAAAIVGTSYAFSAISTSPTCRTSRHAIFMSDPQTDQANNKKSTKLTRSSISKYQRIKNAGVQAWERMDTMKAAGFERDVMVPMQSGFKTNVGLLVAAFLFKWYRARFITKVWHDN